MIAREIHTVGIMFDHVPGADSRSFPRLGEIPWEWHGEACVEVPEGLEHFLAIAWDPRSYMYGEEDRRAMGVTNWDAVRGTIDAYATGTGTVDVPEVGRMSRGMGRTEEDALADAVAEALEVGACQFGRVLAVAPARDLEEDEDGFVDVKAEAHNDMLEEFVRMRSALEDYPLLDEDAYSALEWEAWQEYAPMALRDELRDAVRDGTLEDEVADKLEDVLEDLLGILTQHLHYENGFSGEYGPQFLEIMFELANLSSRLAPVGQESMLPVEADYREKDARKLRILLESAGLSLEDVLA